MWLLVEVITAFDLYQKHWDEGPVSIASNDPVSDDQVRKKMTAEIWSNVLITREGRHFQVMRSKDQRPAISPLICRPVVRGAVRHD